MNTTYKELFKLYDLIQNSDIRAVEEYLTVHTLPINDILPCKGISVLHLAVGIEPVEKSIECTEVILKHGGDPNVCNEDLITPVHIAAIWGRVENIRLLLGCGGDPSIKDLEGFSAYDYAAREEQWEVYDYLHNIVDQAENSFEAPCSYTLSLDKILVTTDQMVAEYEPLTEKQVRNSTCRKSEMVRDWCEKNSFAMNKLYPTILGETYLIENESEPWRDFTKSVNIDLTKERTSNGQELETTCNSFKTCLTEKGCEVHSKDAEPEITPDLTMSCSCNSNNSSKKNRFSVYENFSLPGSPNNITHKNYNTKSSLKKCKGKCGDSLCTMLKQRLIINDSHSLLTEDRSMNLDKAIAVAENKTNEWLFNRGSINRTSEVVDIPGYNTRRSSASSGVSSNFSSGSIVLANLEEEYKYEDKDEEVVLIEKRLRVSPIILPVDDTADTSPDQTIMSIASSLPPSVSIDNKTLRDELIKLGFTPGPVQENTRSLYLKKLQTLKKSPLIVKSKGKTYSVELERSLRNDEWMRHLTPYIELEQKARAEFAMDRKWRGGTAKTSFTYLLLDPRMTDNLPSRGSQDPHTSWVTFVNSIFYVGKGKRSRPYSHLYQALTLWKRDFKTTKDQKVQHILDIWSDKVGVICLHIFQNVIPAEAFTYEAAMIDVLGLSNLKNRICGNYYGAVASWPMKERKMLGLYLLYKAMQIFLSEGERQLRPGDIE